MVTTAAIGPRESGTGGGFTSPKSSTGWASGRSFSTPADCQPPRPDSTPGGGPHTNVGLAALRRAIEPRDRGCTAPGCDRPADWCDIHHVWHWEDGGPTSYDNGRMLCRHHHIQEHRNDHHGPEPP